MKMTYNILCVAIIITLLGCESFISIDAPRTQIEQSKIFSNNVAATSAATGLYYRLAQQNQIFFNGGITIYAGLSSDEIINTTINGTYDPFRLNILDQTNSTLNQTFWTAPYNYIFHANAVIEGLHSSGNISVEVKDQLHGEMLFIRSLIYFYLVNLYADVPLVLTTDFPHNELMPRTPKEKIYRQITEDLVSAKQLLNSNHLNERKLRANKMAVSSLLARVYLYQSNWHEAASEASEVINSGMYMITNLENVFLTNSTEAIFQLTMATNQTIVTSEGFNFNPTSPIARPLFALNDVLLNTFEPNDRRLDEWTNTNTFGGIEYAYPHKYKVRTVTSSSARPEYIMVLRLGEQYLIRAEALARQGRSKDAINDLNVIRARAGLPDIEEVNPQLSEEELLDAIYKERQVELFAEWGHRWFDLKRTNRTDLVLSETKENWKSFKALFPIPFNQMLTNSSLTQNEGYN